MPVAKSDGSVGILLIEDNQAEEDIAKTYELGARCYCTKPIDLDLFVDMVKTVANFWLTIVKLPRR